MNGPRPPERESWNIISITAHRNLQPQDRGVIHTTMQRIVKSPDVDAVCFGGARGGDTEALLSALYYRGASKRPWLTVVVPDTLKKQPKETQYWSEKADEILELGNPITASDKFKAYMIRDRYLVDIASILVGFFNGDYKSGTGKTIRMAEKDGLVVIKVPLSTV